MQEDKEREIRREEMMKSGHPLYQPGARLAPRRADEIVIELQQKKE